MGQSIRSLDQAMTMLGFSDFKSINQERATVAIAKGCDVLTILPTGGGKTACFILPTLMHGWLTVVISPLRSLIDDQVMKLRGVGIPCAAIYGGMKVSEKNEIRNYAEDRPEGTPMIIYTTPETALTKWFENAFGDAAINLLAFDEAHCVSTWGESFRPDYLRTTEIIRRLQVQQVAALTATADQKIIDDIERRVPLGKNGNEYVKVQSNPYRPNLHFKTEQPGTKEDMVSARVALATRRLGRILSLQDEYHGPTLVYCRMRRTCGDLIQTFGRSVQKLGYTPILYHAALPMEDRTLGLQLFQEKEKPLVFCTSAFGMGIDRADIRRCIHFDVPSHLVELAQQSGRTGRDGLPSLCTTFYDPRYLDAIDSRVKFTVPSAKFVEIVYGNLKRRYIQAERKERGSFRLSTFMHTLHHAHAAKHPPNRTDHYMNSVTRSIGVLRKAHVIVEDDQGFRLKKMEPGAPSHSRVLDITKMDERTIVRESKRIRTLFEQETDDFQAEMWRLIQAA